MAICGSKDDDGFTLLEAVHFAEYLIQGLFAFIVTTTNTSATYSAHSVNFIDKYDAGGCFAGSFEQIPNSGRSNSHEHLYEL